VLLFCLPSPRQTMQWPTIKCIPEVHNVWHNFKVQRHLPTSPNFHRGQKVRFWPYRSTSLHYKPLSYQNEVRYLHHFLTWCTAMIGSGMKSWSQSLGLQTVFRHCFETSQSWENQRRSQPSLKQKTKGLGLISVLHVKVSFYKLIFNDRSSPKLAAATCMQFM